VRPERKVIDGRRTSHLSISLEFSACVRVTATHHNSLVDITAGSCCKKGKKVNRAPKKERSVGERTAQVSDDRCRGEKNSQEDSTNAGSLHCPLFESRQPGIVSSMDLLDGVGDAPVRSEKRVDGPGFSLPCCKTKFSIQLQHLQRFSAQRRDAVRRTGRRFFSRTPQPRPMSCP
jgi:hypothetical protein